MSLRLPPLSSLRFFEAAARHMSFKHAARELCVTPGAVSLQIKALEQDLGVDLFRRLPRRLELTVQGRALLPKVREGMECFTAAVQAVRALAGAELTVHAPPAFAQRWLVPRLAGFSAAHPDLALRLSSDVANIDGVGGAPQGVDGDAVAIRFGAGHYPFCVVEEVLLPDYVLVASPDLLARSAPLRGPADLLAHTLIHDESIPDETLRSTWAEWFRLAGVGEVDTSRGPRFSGAVLVLEAVLGGQGVALALSPLVEADLAAGRLVMPFALRLPSRFAYYLVTPESQAQRPAAMAFRRWLRAQGAETAKNVAGEGKTPGDIIAG